MKSFLRFVVVALVVCSPASRAGAQDLFEIQVYPYDTMEPGRTMFEFHTNFIPSGTKDTSDGQYANHHQFHETLEITHGWTKHFETGFYFETAYVPGVGEKFTGFHIRPRFSLPEYESFPFHVSVSLEYAWTQPGFDPNPQTLEIRPIFERVDGRLYLSINPSMSVAAKGPDAGSAPSFEPSAKIGWDFSKQVQAGIEYYAETGTVRHFDPMGDQHHMLFPAVDFNVSPDWELNFGVGRGLTGTSEHWIVKGIVGYRFKH
jgi:Putative MetA-pathway of phenol degradation